jgi:SOS-response transcriptional repressor LexA
LDVLRFVGDAYGARGYGLTVREVAGQFGWSSPNAAFIHLKRLKAAGLVTWEPRQLRTIRPTEVIA